MTSLEDAILQEDISQVRNLMRYTREISYIDKYGFTPLIEAAIVDNLEISQLLLSTGANPNQQDVTGGTPLQWAVENNNIALCKLLIEHHANPNAYNLAGQPILVMPILRQQKELQKFLQNAGADLSFAQDYINTKLIGHSYELVGMAHIISPDNQFVDVDFEGFYLEVTLGLIADSIAQFQNHFAARHLRRYSGLALFIVDVMQRGLQLIKFQQYRVNIDKHEGKINSLIMQEPLLIPVGYEGHAITFIKYGDIWIKCDRREDSRLFDNVMFYRINNIRNASPEFLKSLIYKKQSDEFINNQLDQILGLEPITELKIEAQISGNCSWANVEATLPAIFFLMLMQMNKDDKKIQHYKTLALNFFHRWQDWNKDRALQFCMQRFNNSDSIRKTSQAEMMAAILFQTSHSIKSSDKDRAELILNLLIGSKYEYILKNYLRIYYYESATEEGKRFADLLKEHHFTV